LALQQLAYKTDLIIQACHYLQGTSTGRSSIVCSATSQNRRPTPLASLLVYMEMNSNTATKTGLKISSGLDSNTYAKGIKVSDDEMASHNPRHVPPRMELQRRVGKPEDGAIVLGRRF